MFGFRPFSTSYGVDNSKALVPTRLIRYVECLTPSPQRKFGTCMCLRMLLVISINVRFLRSTMPFCWGEYGAVSCLLIPESSQKDLNSLEVNSPPLSVLKFLIFAFVSASTINLKILNFSNASCFSFKSIDHIYLEQSSMRTKIYLLFPAVGGLMGPQRSPCISSSTVSAR